MLFSLCTFSTVAVKRAMGQSSKMLYWRSRAIVQSAVALEKIFNIKLIECNERNILLTSAGEVVRLRAQVIDAELRGILNDAMWRATRDRGCVGKMEVLFNERCLKIVSMLADAHHISIVARTMEMSQSAVAQMVANLEDLLGRSLFRTTAKGIVPSDGGTRWIMRFNKVLMELNHMEVEIDELKFLFKA
jgi:LysR family transcriptional regulator of gallate degradation